MVQEVKMPRPFTPVIQNIMIHRGVLREDITRTKRKVNYSNN